MSRRAAPSYIEDPLPLECLTCQRQWPQECSCAHPARCRGCAKPLADPTCSAGYCSIRCLHRLDPTTDHRPPPR